MDTESSATDDGSRSSGGTTAPLSGRGDGRGVGGINTALDRQGLLPESQTSIEGHDALKAHEEPKSEASDEKENTENQHR